MKSIAASAAVPARVMPALLLLAAEGASVAFFLRALRGARWLPAFVARNELSPHGRDHLISWLVVGATVPCVVFFATVAVAWRTGGRAAAAERTEQAGSAARLLAVCVVLWAVPPMLSVQAWIGRDLSFLLSAAVLVLALERSLREARRLDALDALRAWSSRIQTGSRLRSWAPHGVVALLDQPARPRARCVAGYSLSREVSGRATLRKASARRQRLAVRRSNARHGARAGRCARQGKVRRLRARCRTSTRRGRGSKVPLRHLARCDA
ncbi:MAG: hypothetical protein AMXMBFR56_56410 [Polyangiaceae bacterium]